MELIMNADLKLDKYRKVIKAVEQANKSIEKLV